MKRGFTLIEMMVSITIFTILVLAGMGALFSISDNYENTQASSAAMDNLEFVVEALARRIRTGYDIRCSVRETIYDCYERGSKEIQFVDQDGRRTVYRLISSLSGPYLAREKTVPKGEEGCKQDTGCVSRDILTRPLELKLRDESIFYIKGGDVDDEIQPQVLIRIRGSSRYKGVESEFSLQTVAVQRLLDKLEPIPVP